MGFEKSGELFYISNDGHEIPAIVELPEGGAGLPAVVMLHGTASHKDEVGGSYRRLAKLMAKAGIASIRIDFMGHGDSKAFDGDFCFQSARSDLMAALTCLQQTERIDAGRIGLMGWSQGGTHTYLAAAEENTFRSVVTWASGLADFNIIATEEVRVEAKEKGYGVQKFPWGDKAINVGQKWIDDVDRLDILAAARKIEVPVLAVIGTEDFMSVEGVEEIIAACPNPDSKMYVIEGGNHTFNALTPDTRVFYDGANATINWWHETL